MEFTNYYSCGTCVSQGVITEINDCLRNQRDQLRARVEQWKAFAERLEIAGDTLATVTLRNGRSHDQWHAAKETKP